jgi:hypothetical protein
MGEELMGDGQTGPGPARSSARKGWDIAIYVDELLSATGTSPPENIYKLHCYTQRGEASLRSPAPPVNFPTTKLACRNERREQKGKERKKQIQPPQPSPAPAANAAAPSPSRPPL